MRRALVLALLGCQPRAVMPARLACDGSDDTRALQRALDGGGRVALRARSTCRFSRLAIAVPVELDLAGATLQPLAGDGPYLRVLADHVAIRHGTIAGGAGGSGWLVDWHGAAGVLEDVTLQHGGSIGLSVSAGDVTARRVIARDFTGATGIGFRVGAGALITEDCAAEACSYAGFFVSQTASPATVLDASTTRNGIGLAIDGSGGRIARLSSRDDDRFGLLLDHGASGWRVDRVRVEHPGRTARNPSATGVELFAHNQRNRFADIAVLGAPGYGLAIAGGSEDNRFARVRLDARGGWDGDPGIVICGGSHRNRIDDAVVLGHTVGVRIGENDLRPDDDNNDNHIGALRVDGAHHNAIRIERGHRNTIDEATISNSDSAGSAAAGFPGVIYLDASDNRIDRIITSSAASPSMRPISKPHAAPITP